MLRTIISVIASAVLLILAYPQIEWWGLAWIGMVPVLLAINGKSYKSAFGWGFLTGFLFFFGTLGWFVYVTYPGAILLIAYISLYFAVFALAFRFFQPLPIVLRSLVLSSVWTVLELIRAHLFSGFGWVMLGHSQYKNTLLIQCADITGVYGVSFLVMLVNVLVFETIKNAKQIRHLQIIVGVLISLVLGYGFWKVSNVPAWPTVAVGVVQPNIAQDQKWNPQMQPAVVQKTIFLSHAFKTYAPDLIVWPETSLPGIVSDVPYLVAAIKMAVHNIHTPVLMGAITDDQGQYFNSAYLISSDGQMGARYDKIHLVPFGEFIPLRPLLGWINHFVALEDFTSGKQYTIFKASNQPFGVLICFEDTLGYLRRNLANAGAGFFVNMTNDAWFMDTKAPFIHLQAAAFGCVENMRSLVRSANTGFSGFIDPFGRVIASVQDEHHKKTFVSGTAFARIPVVMTKTFYTKYGDVFTGLCFLTILWALNQRRRMRR